MRLDFAAFWAFMHDMEWVVVGGICLAVVAFGFARHVYYVAKNVWAVRRALDKPQRTLPPAGIVTINGIVSTIETGSPVKVTIEERGKAGRGQMFWEQSSRVVEAHPFALLLPEANARIVVEPGDDVHLRASATMTEWEQSTEPEKLSRWRTGTLEDGDRAIVTGVLEEKREVELIASEYRSSKEKVHIEYVLRPIPDEPMQIDSETLLIEIRECFGYIGWWRGIGTIVLGYAYVHALWDTFLDRSAKVYGALVLVYAIVPLFRQFKNRLPWFDRHKSRKKPYYGAEDFAYSKFRS